MNDFSYVLFRTPLQSLKEALNFHHNQTIPAFNDGIYLSSPEFWNEYQKIEKLTSGNKEKLNRSFVKYWLRSCARSTPYGTLAGCFLAPISGSKTNLILNENNAHFRKVRLDMNFVTEIVVSLMKHPLVLQQVKFYPNNSLYNIGNEWRYAEYAIENNTRTYHLTSIEDAPYIHAILDLASEGATLKSLSSLLVTSQNVTDAEAEEFLMEMWTSQLLISELDSCVTGIEPFDQLMIHLSNFVGIDNIVQQLNTIKVLLEEPKEGVLYLQNIEEELKNLIIIIHNDYSQGQENHFSDELNTERNKFIDTVKVPKNTLQVDLFLSVKKNNISVSLIEKCLAQVEDLFFLAKKNEHTQLKNFIDRFTALYGEIEIPLSIALDSDLGIGYGNGRDENAGDSEVIDNLALGFNGNGSTSSFNRLQEYALHKYDDYVHDNQDIIELKEDELKEFKEYTKAFNFSSSLALMGQLLKKDGKFDEENFILDISSFGGTSACNLLGRFTHGDEELCTLTKKILQVQEQENPDIIYAEIAHLPQARIGNILLRPVLRAYEIPYVGRSGALPENQIPVSDLMVSVKNNEVILRSKQHNKRIIPSLTTAHNFTYQSLPIYKFLCDLQMQGMAFPNMWDWGSLSTLKHLPRVTYKNLILQRATWKIKEKDISDLPKNEKEYIDFFASFRQLHKLPKRVVYVEGDNELLIDFENERCIDLLLHYLKRHKNILLREFLFTEENCIIHDTNGNPYTNEIIIPLQRGAKTNNGLKHSKINAPASIKQKFSPYSEWLYFKVYCGAKTAEKLLVGAILPFIKEGLDNKLFERFFFIRFRDEGGGHFRIRFYNQNKEKQLSLYHEFMQILQPLIDSGSIKNITLDSYLREQERYRPELIEEAEALFHNDSLAVLGLINMLEDTVESNKYRMLLALRGIDLLLNDFRFQLSDKKELMENLQVGFFKEFGASSILKKQLNDRYRKYKRMIFTHMDPELDIENGIDEAVELFKVRSSQNEPIIKCIFEKINSAENKAILFELLPSYIHMFMNRLFIAQHRKYELVIYHFLERHYTSQVSILSKKQIITS